MAKENIPRVASMMEDIVGCKWSLVVLGLIRQGVARPGAMEHAVEGLSKKVLNERLKKLQRFGIVDRRAFAEVPPRVEYRLSAFGGRFVKLLDEIAVLEASLKEAAAAAAPRGPSVSRSR